MLSNTEGLLRFEEAENAWGTAMTDEDRRLAQLLRENHATRVSQVSGESTKAFAATSIFKFVGTAAVQLQTTTARLAVQICPCQRISGYIRHFVV